VKRVAARPKGTALLRNLPPSIKPALLSWGLGAIIKTCTVQSNGMERLRELEAKGQPWIYCIWHNSSTMAAYIRRNRNIAIMASASRDGEIIAGSIERLGNLPVRGSTSSRGGQAARAMVRALRAGHCGGITPDGPRGPAYRCQIGALWIAALAGCPVVPYEFDADRQWRLRSWDRHKIPKFFSTLYEYVGEPMYVGREELASDEERVLQRFQALMLDNTRKCMEAAGNTEDIQWLDRTIGDRD
jgi:lysophospholipid acyltransferase (LPLAT)-like uncharacterized protein